MDILGLTTFDQIRGVLAVSPADLPDEILTPYGLEDDLEANLEEWLPDWQTVLNQGEARDQRMLRLFAKYYCAGLAAVAGQNFMLTRFSDGEVEGQRSDTEGYQALRVRIEERAGEFRRKLTESLTPSTSETFVAAMGRVTPSRDVITTGRS